MSCINPEIYLIGYCMVSEMDKEVREFFCIRAIILLVMDMCNGSRLWANIWANFFPSSVFVFAF